ncbi:acyl-CoA dehydrogenase family protein [Maribacter sp. 2304DJ31-5]|uniref:acyl-CoA dehydrogenase family protein n=1 Tax=Maribacter sp. 2304DJ31-5 TaxID=3386273 RepID=UPI0039BC274D
METTVRTKDWKQLTHKLGPSFAKNVDQNDAEGRFAHENYALLKSEKFFSALIPTELGGGGVTYNEMCNIIRIMAHYCGSTALAFSMHQHLVATTVWKYKHKNEGAETLRRIAKDQLTLVSTGAKDWLGSNGELIQTEGGYLLSAKKHFASQSVVGDIAVTSSIFKDLEGKESVLHFSTPLQQKGVTFLDDWNTLGMRATGSQTIVFNKVFIPKGAIALKRDGNEFHPVWNVVLTVAMPLIMSAYIGLAQKAEALAIESAKRRSQNHTNYSIGQLHTTFLGCKVQWNAMLEMANNLDFKPLSRNTADTLAYKTNVSNLAKETVSQALEIIGGQGFYKEHEIERLFRDVQASTFHPLPKWNQYEFTGKQIIGN